MLTQKIFSIKFSAQSKHNLLIFPLLFTILQFNFPIFTWPFGHFNLGTFSLSLFERPLSSIQFN